MASQLIQNLRNMAIFGNQPAFHQPLFVGKPNIGNREKFLGMVNAMLDRRWLSNHGQFAQEFERRLAEFLGVKHCVVCCNATVALECAGATLGMSGEVILPSYTFIATAHSVMWRGAKPVFCDIDERTHCLDPERVEELITPATTGILAVHLWGRPCNIQRLTEIAQRRHLALLFDAAHAFGASYQGQMLGNFGDAEVFSFHATKFMNSFEGGVITTNNDALAQRIRRINNFGFEGNDNVVALGTNGKMTEVCAAMGLVNLDSLEEFIAVNHGNYQCYQQCLSAIPGIRLMPYDGGERFNYQYMVIEVDEAKCGLTRDNLLRVLHAENIMARKYFWPGCHRMEPYRTFFPDAGEHLPVTEKVANRVIVLPTGTAMNEESITKVCDIISLAVEHAEEVNTVLEVK